MKENKNQSYRLWINMIYVLLLILLLIFDIQSLVIWLILIASWFWADAKVARYTMERVKSQRQIDGQN